MGASKRRRSDRAGRLPMQSPSRPPVGRREHRQRFWEAIARGLSSEESGVVSWFNEQRLLGPIGDIPPAEFEQMYYQQQQSRLDEAGLN